MFLWVYRMSTSWSDLSCGSGVIVAVPYYTIGTICFNWPTRISFIFVLMIG